MYFSECNHKSCNLHQRWEWPPCGVPKAVNTCDLEFDLSRSSNIKGHITIWKPMYGFLSVSNTNYVYKVNGFRVIKGSKSVTLRLTVQGYPTSKIISPFETPYMISYLCLKQTTCMCLKWMVSELYSKQSQWP